MAIHILTNGDEFEVYPKNGVDFTLEELQAYVGGLIEFVYLKDGNILVINEEGKLRNLEANYSASMIYEENFGPIDIIVGDVLVCSPEEVGE